MQATLAAQHHQTAEEKEEHERIRLEAEATARSAWQTKVKAYEDSRPKQVGAFAPFIMIADMMYKIIHSRPWAQLLYFTVLTSTVQVAINTYPEMKLANGMAEVDMVTATIFMLEVAIKIISEGTRPWMYFRECPRASRTSVSCDVT